MRARACVRAGACASVQVMLDARAQCAARRCAIGEIHQAYRCGRLWAAPPAALAPAAANPTAAPTNAQPLAELPRGSQRTL
eukprot:3280075-Pleurochrysis_carterae.AAC.3